MRPPAITLVEGKAVAWVRRTVGDKRKRTVDMFRGQVFPPVQDLKEHFSLRPIRLEKQGVSALKPAGFHWKVNMVDAVNRSVIPKVLPWRPRASDTSEERFPAMARSLGRRCEPAEGR